MALVLASLMNKKKKKKKPRDDGDVAKYDPAPSDAATYGRMDFWDERRVLLCEAPPLMRMRRYLYTPDPFEWYHDYWALRGMLDELVVDKEGKILVVGCGNSNLAADMYADGYKHVMSVDHSRVVIDQMMTRHRKISQQPAEAAKEGGAAPTTKAIPKIFGAEDLSGIQWRQCNCTDLRATFDGPIFDLILDKAFLDALYCAEVPALSVGNFLQEADRVLKPTGRYICISHGQPEARLEKLEDPDVDSEGFLAWRVTVSAIPKPMVNPFAVSDLKRPGDVYYVYTCLKDERLQAAKEQRDRARKAKAAGRKARDKRAIKAKKRGRSKLASINLAPV